MAFFPLFVDLKDKKCVVIGGGSTAQRKVSQLLNFDAEIKVVSPSFTKKLQNLCNKKKIIIEKKEFDATDIEDAFLVVAATSNSSINDTIKATAINKNKLVNVVDGFKESCFIFPAIIKKGDIVIGISTSGKYPLLAAYLKDFLKKKIPRNIEKLILTLYKYREKIKKEVNDINLRKKILKSITNKVLAGIPLKEKILNEKLEVIIRDSKNEKKV